MVVAPDENIFELKSYVILNGDDQLDDGSYECDWIDAVKADDGNCIAEIALFCDEFMMFVFEFDVLLFVRLFVRDAKLDAAPGVG